MFNPCAFALTLRSDASGERVCAQLYGKWLAREGTSNKYTRHAHAGDALDALDARSVLRKGTVRAKMLGDGRFEISTLQRAYDERLLVESVQAHNWVDSSVESESEDDSERSGQSESALRVEQQQAAQVDLAAGRHIALYARNNDSSPERWLAKIVRSKVWVHWFTEWADGLYVLHDRVEPELVNADATLTNAPLVRRSGAVWTQPSPAAAEGADAAAPLDLSSGRCVAGGWRRQDTSPSLRVRAPPQAAFPNKRFIRRKRSS